MKRTHKSSSQAALRWLWALAAGFVLLLPAVAEAAAGAGDRPESESYKSSSGGSSSGGSRGSSSSTSSKGSSSGSKAGSVRSAGSSSSSSSSGKTQSVRDRQTSSGRGGSSGGGSGYSGGGYSGGGSHHYGGYRGHRSYYPRHYRGSSLYLSFGYPYYGYWPYFYPYYPYYAGYNRRPYYVTEDALGALDLNVKPKDTQVYVNGRLVGTAGQFDGVPRYLWLETGTYELILFNPGYETVVREVEIHPDLVIDVKLRMASGEAVAVEQLSRRLAEPAPEPPRTEIEQAWRQAPPARPPLAEPLRAEQAPSSAGSQAVDVRQRPATVLISVEPADASVYLDGRFVGNSRELASGLLVDPGQHRFEIVHPSFQTRALAFEVTADENVRFDIRLEALPAGTG